MRSMVFASLSVRLRVDVEALNMVEALGAYGRHRTVSILKPRPDGRGYRVIIAPAVSGQAVAYGYMKALVALAQRKGLPVCDECREYEVRGGFLKHATSTDANLSEWKLVEQCVVEDLTGFLVARGEGRGVIRRTSPVCFSYMLPDVESSDVALDPQFHVRAPMPGREPQPFQVEAGTAVYTLSVFIDLDRIGKGYEMAEGKASSKARRGRKTEGDEEQEEVESLALIPRTLNDTERQKRIECAFEALGCLLEGLMFGAKKARYLPALEIVGAVAALSRPLPFMVNPARLSRSRDYISATIERAGKYSSMLSSIGEEIIVFYLDKEGVYTPNEASSQGLCGVAVGTFSALIDELKKKAVELVSGASGKR